MIRLPLRSRPRSASEKETRSALQVERLEERMMLSTVEIIAAGVENSETMQLLIDGNVEQTWNNIGGDAYGGQFETYSWSTGDNIIADQVRVRFTNDLYDPANNFDRNLRVDAIIIDGTRYETEAPNVFSNGTWKPEDGIVPGFRESEFLHSNGYFQYAGGGQTGTTNITVIVKRPI